MSGRGRWERWLGCTVGFMAGYKGWRRRWLWEYGRCATDTMGEGGGGEARGEVSGTRQVARGKWHEASGTMQVVVRQVVVRQVWHKASGRMDGTCISSSSINILSPISDRRDCWRSIAVAASIGAAILTRRPSAAPPPEPSPEAPPTCSELLRMETRLPADARGDGIACGDGVACGNGDCIAFTTSSSIALRLISSADAPNDELLSKLFPRRAPPLPKLSTRTGLGPAPAIALAAPEWEAARLIGEACFPMRLGEGSILSILACAPHAYSVHAPREKDGMDAKWSARGQCVACRVYTAGIARGQCLAWYVRRVIVVVRRVQTQWDVCVVE